MGAAERVGVVAVGEKHHPHVEVLFQEHVDTPKRSFDTGRVAVVQNGDIARKARHQLDLVLGERGARRGHHIGNAGLVQRNHVGITLHQIGHVFGNNLALGLKNAVKHVALAVYGRFGRINIFGLGFVGVQHPAAKGNHAPGEAVYGKHYPAAKTVEHLARLVLFFYRQPTFHQGFF